MKNVKLIKLSIANFEGAEFKELDFNADLNGFTAPNGYGKTTIFNAWNWLLFDKKCEFEPRDKDNKLKLNITTSVVALLSVNDVNVELKKENHKKIVKGVYTGTANKFFIDGYEKKSTEFDKYINDEIADLEVFKIITNINYFNSELDVNKRREWLIKLSGISKKTNLFELICSKNEILKTSEYIKDIFDKKIKIDDAIKKNKDDLKTFEKENISYPILIAEKKASIKDLKSKAEIEKELAIIDDKIKKEVDNVAPNEIEIKINELKFEIDNFKKNQEVKKQSELNEINSQINKIKINTNEIEQLNIKLAELKTNYLEKNALQFNRDSNKCDKCGAILVAKTEEEVNLLEVAFNKKKKAEIDAILKLANEIKAKKIKLEELDKVNKDKLKELNTQKTTILKTEIQEPTAQIEILNALVSELEKTPKNNKLDELLSLKYDFEKLLTLIDINEKLATEVVDLEKKYKEISNETNKIEKNLYELDLYKNASLQIVEDAVNELFTDVYYKLFENQKNGGVKNIASCIYKGVSYQTTLNTGAKILADIEVVKVFVNKFDLKLPIFVDNFESFTNEISYNLSQVITFSASKISNF